MYKCYQSFSVHDAWFWQPVLHTVSLVIALILWYSVSGKKALEHLQLQNANNNNNNDRLTAFDPGQPG